MCVHRGDDDDRSGVQKPTGGAGLVKNGGRSVRSWKGELNTHGRNPTRRSCERQRILGI